jgi:hypothetical protein
VGPAVWLGVGDLGVRVETAVTQGKNDVMPGRWPVVSVSGFLHDVDGSIGVGFHFSGDGTLQACRVSDLRMGSSQLGSKP